MSRKYKQSSEVPNNVLIKRLEEISDACTKGHKEIARTFVMRIPAEVDFCPDLVISEAANRLNQLSRAQARLEEAESVIRKAIMGLEYSAHNLAFDAEIDSGGFTIESTCPERTLLIELRDLKHFLTNQNTGKE